MIDPTKRSVFYCLFLKTLLTVTKMDEFKAMKLLSTTVLDASKLEEVKDLPVDKLTIKEVCHIAVLQRVTKLVHSAILLYVNQPKHGQSN